MDLRLRPERDGNIRVTVHLAKGFRFTEIGDRDRGLDEIDEERRWWW